MLGGGAPVAPHADQELFSVFAHLKPASPTAFTARGLFEVIVENHSRLVQGLDRMADQIINSVGGLRDEFDRHLAFREAVRRPHRRPVLPSGTRLLLRELAGSLLLDGGTRLVRNHAIDLLRAVVPVAYCDLVLLDKHWQTQVDRVRSYFGEAGISVPVAKVFSAKENGIERFLRELEQGDI